MKLTFDKRRGYTVVYNSKGEKLGTIWLFDKWHCFVWEQSEYIVMSSDCLEQVVAKMKEMDDKL